MALHWSLLDTHHFFGRIDNGALFALSRPQRVAGIETRELPGEDHLVCACCDLALHHGYNPALYRSYELAAHILGPGPHSTGRHSRHR